MDDWICAYEVFFFLVIAVWLFREVIIGRPVDKTRNGSDHD